MQLLGNLEYAEMTSRKEKRLCHRDSSRSPLYAKRSILNSSLISSATHEPSKFCALFHNQITYYLVFVGWVNNDV